MPAAPTAAALVKAAKKALGVKTDDDLARALDRRYGIKRSQSTVNRWKNLNEPGYDATMALLDAAGWLNVGAEEPTLRVLPVSPDSPVADALEGLAANQTEAMRALVVIAEALGLRVTDLGLPELPPASQPAGPKRRSPR